MVLVSMMVVLLAYQWLIICPFFSWHCGNFQEDTECG